MTKKKQKTWFETTFPGVRYRKHASRRHGVKQDCYFQIRYQQGGRRVEEALGWGSDGMTARKAALILAELKEAARTGKGEATLKERRAIVTKAREEEATGKVTFGEFWQKTYWPHAQAEKAKGSVIREKSFFKCWLSPLFGPLPLPSISVIHLEKLKSTMSKAGQSPRSIQYALAVTRQVINEARRRGVFTGENPVKRVRSPKVDNRRMRFLTPQEAEALLSELERTDPTAWEMTLLALHCGLRAGEIFKLTFGDLDFERGLIAIKDPKSGRSRFAHMTETIKEMLGGKHTGDPTELLYPGPGGKIRYEIPRTFGEATEKLGFNEGREDRRDRIVFHSCRHSYASWLVQRGVDLYTVRELLGHATLGMTARYSHLAPENSKRATQILEGVLNGTQNKAQDRGAYGKAQG